MKTILITGASSGIGKEFAMIAATHGHNVVLVARSESILQEMKRSIEAKHNVTVHICVQNLSIPNSAQRVYDAMQSQAITVDYIVNNAGFGHYGLFAGEDISIHTQMVQLNCTSLMELTRLFVPGMIARSTGGVLNIASIAALVPGPLQAVYFATKAFVLSFTESLAEEFVGTGVTATVLCPGPVATKFADAAAMSQSPLFKKSQSAKQVAYVGFNAMMRGKRMVFSRWSDAIVMRFFLPWVPRIVRAKIIKKMQYMKGA